MQPCEPVVNTVSSEDASNIHFHDRLRGSDGDHRRRRVVDAHRAERQVLGYLEQLHWGQIAVVGMIADALGAMVAGSLALGEEHRV